MQQVPPRALNPLYTIPSEYHPGFSRHIQFPFDPDTKSPRILLDSFPFFIFFKTASPSPPIYCNFSKHPSTDCDRFLSESEPGDGKGLTFG